MLTGLRLVLIFAAVCFIPNGLWATVLLQQNTEYLAFEAEQFTTLTPGTSSAEWEVITTSSGANVLPPNTNAAGAALYNHTTGGGNAFSSYTLQFTSNGSYHLYTRYSFYDRVNDANYGNEDSIHLPGAFNQASNTSGTWHVQHLGTQGHVPTTNPNDGQNFYWDLANTLDTGSPAVLYEITGASEENPVEVTFTLRNRENGVAVDRFVFIKDPQTLTGGDSAFLNGLSSVPEPSRALLSLCAGLGLLVNRRRKNLQAGCW